jgi:hypothetical protein
MSQGPSAEEETMTEKPSEWPAAAVAITVLVLVGAVTIAAIFNSNNQMEEALKIWEPMSALLALFTGAFVTFFFTRSSVQAAQFQARNAILLAEQQQRRAELTQQALTKAAGELEPETWKRLSNDPVVGLATSLVDDGTNGFGMGAPLRAG